MVIEMKGTRGSGWKYLDSRERIGITEKNQEKNTDKSKTKRRYTRRDCDCDVKTREGGIETGKIRYTRHNTKRHSEWCFDINLRCYVGWRVYYSEG